ncbi:MAG: anthranilate phosphoribosyltransferase [Acidimicrobiia bacterium]|jgi:anthranilate phosphoribosyltransferase
MKTLIDTILSGKTLTEAEAGELLGHLTSDELDHAQAAAALAGMRTRGETADEMRAFAMGLQEKAVAPAIDDVSGAVDVVGTGGDASGSLNLSTGAALVAAAAGAEVIKHGNRSVSSKSGSFDVLVALGLDLPWDRDRAGEVFSETGFTYLFAPAFHPSMKTVAPVRQALGTRTIFNLIGPLANPARTPHLVVGAFSLECARMMADTLSGMDITRAFVVHGEPGWDEPTPVGPYAIFDVRPGSVSAAEEDPESFGFARCAPEDLLGGDAEHNAEAIRDVFSGAPGHHRDALVLGASLALRVTGAALGESLDRAATAIDDGSASTLLYRLTGASDV